MQRPNTRCSSASAMSRPVASSKAAPTTNCCARPARTPTFLPRRRAVITKLQIARSAPMNTRASPTERDPPLAALLRLVAAQDAQVSGCIDLDQAGWRTLVREAFRHGVAPLAWTRLRGASARESIPPWALHDLQRSYFQAGLDNLRRYGKLAPLLRRFAADGIDTLVLKGAFLADVV